MIFLVVIGIVVILAIISAVFGGAGVSQKITGVSTGGYAPAPSAYDQAAGESGYGVDARNAAESPIADVTGASTVDRSIIRTGFLSLLVESTDEAAGKIGAIAKRMGGFVDSLRMNESTAGEKTGYVVIRVPEARFDATLAAVKDLAEKVEDEQIQSQDVTEQLVDLDARLRNAEAEEAQYLDILADARTVEDTLKVTALLSQTRERIERLKAQIKLLSEQVAMSTISVSLTSDAEVEVLGIHWRPLLVLKQGLHDLLAGLAGFVDAVIVIIFKLPIIGLWLVVIGILSFLAWRIGRFFFRRFAMKPAPPAAKVKK